MKIFETTTQMALSNLTVGQLVQTKGYSVPGDEGQQDYLIAVPQAVNEVEDFTLANSNVALLQRTATVASVIPRIGGGALTVSKINELQDGSTYTLPLANSTNANASMLITLPSTFGAFTPTVQAGGSDTITDIGGVDTEIIFAAADEIRLTSDGVSVWRL